MRTSSSNWSDPLSTYIGALGEVEILSPEEEHRLIRKYRDEKCLESRDRVIKGSLRYVVHRVRDKCQLSKGQATSGGTADNWASFAGARMSRVVLSDLIADATAALFRALDLFDPDKAGGGRFVLYARWYVDEAIRRTLSRQRSMAGTVHECKSEHNAAQKIEKLKHELTGVIADDVEIVMAKTSLGRGVVTRVLNRQFNVTYAEKVANMSRADAGDVHEASRWDLHAATAGEPPRQVETAEEDERARTLSALISMLPPARALSLRLYFGIGGVTYTSQEIAELQGMTHQAINQLLTAGLSDVRNISVSIGLDLRSLQ